jgi:hypothetical protein
MVDTIEGAVTLVTTICQLPGNDQFINDTTQVAKAAGLREAVRKRDTPAFKLRHHRAAQSLARFAHLWLIPQGKRFSVFFLVLRILEDDCRFCEPGKAFL